MVEIMSPAGSFESLQAALQAGADSVYFGLQDLNMRRHGAKNFTIPDLKKIVSMCKERNVKTYLTLNSIIYSEDFKIMREMIDAAKEAEVNAVIACDIAVIQYADSIGQEVHSSTQLNISNIEAVKFYAKFCDVVVLARELTLEQIEEICDEIKKQKIIGPRGELVKVEIFCHGALCVSISGKCYMSLAKFNCSANCGQCMQPCRRTYRVIDEESGEELILDNKYVMSPKDLCTIGFLDKIIESGVSVLKLEGRARPPEYVSKVTQVYKEAANAVESGTYTKEKAEAWTEELGKVFNRGFWQGGYYLGKKLGDWAGCHGSCATEKKSEIGKVLHYYDNKKVAILSIVAEEIQNDDEIFIIGPTTGLLRIKIKELHKDGKPFEGKTKSEDVSLLIENKVRENDKIYLIKKINCKCQNS